MLEWLETHKWWLAVATVVMFAGSILLLRALVVHMRADYFMHRQAPPESWSEHHPALRTALRVGKNALGLVLLVAGIAMLVLPGQGVLTILIGITLLDFPGKRRMELGLVRRPTVRRTIDWMRRQAGRPPLQLPDC